MPDLAYRLRTDPDVETLVAELAMCKAADHHRQTPSPESLAALRASGVLGTVIPTSYGGAGRDSDTVNDLVARIAQVDPSVAIILFQHLAVCARIVEWGSHQQQHAILPLLASGEWLAASAWTEPGAGPNKRRLSTKAQRCADGYWEIQGAKSFTTGASLADLYLVLAQTAESSEVSTYGAPGQSFFLVEATNPGLVADTSLQLAGMCDSATGFIELHDCRVPSTALLGPMNEATRVIASVRESGATLGAVAVGIAAAAYQLTLELLMKRGMLERESIRHRLVNIETQVEAGRALVARAADRRLAQRGLTTLHSKLFAASVGETVVAECQRLLGSAGFLVEHPINRMASDVRAIGLMGPTSDLCRELVSVRWLG